MARLSLILVLLVAARNLQAQAPASPPQVFGPDHVTDVFRVSLDRGALLLESINDVIRAKGIRDGQVIVSSGSVQECTYHYVASTELKAQNEFRTVKGPSEILSGGGIIADGEPHIHIALSNPEKGAYGGHLEKGCRVLYLAEVTVLRFAGSAPLTRKLNPNGISILQRK
jgi:predicted DNA-binding protein with PD1-like motif